MSQLKLKGEIGSQLRFFKAASLREKEKKNLFSGLTWSYSCLVYELKGWKGESERS